MKIGIAQLNPRLNDFQGNLKKIIDASEKLEKQNAELIIFSECILTGYPPKDLLNEPEFIKNINSILENPAEFLKENHEKNLLY